MIIGCLWRCICAMAWIGVYGYDYSPVCYSRTKILRLPQSLEMVCKAERIYFCIIVVTVLPARGAMSLHMESGYWMVRPYPDCSIAFSLDSSMYKCIIVFGSVLMVSAVKLFSMCAGSVVLAYIFRY